MARPDPAPPRSSPRDSVFTIPPGLPFLRTLARAVLDGHLPRPGGAAPADLSQVTILLPTRRAARGLQEAFLDASPQRSLLLPRIRPIAEGNEDLALISAFSGPEVLGVGGADIPPAVGEVERRLVLTSLVQRWSEAMRKRGEAAGDQSAHSITVEAGAGTAAQAAALARELARLIDEVETEGADLSGLTDLVPDRFSEHWGKTLDFLKVILEWWPAHLAEREVISPMDRRNRLVLAEARRLAATPPDGPVIVAGVTGSIPATAELMRVVAGLPGGAVVIPGLDQWLDEDSWLAISSSHANGVKPSGSDIEPSTPASTTRSGAPVAALRPEGSDIAHPEHPQHGLMRLLGALDVSRNDVRVLPGAAPPQPIADRNRLVSEAMRPASTTARWHDFTRDADRATLREALAGVSLVEAPTPEDEGEVIALMLREVAETPGRTAALVTRDRLLARRVAVRLESWGIRVDDSAGRPLAKTMPGVLLDLAIEAVATDFAPGPLMALLKHPLTRLGLPAGEVRRTARAVEIAAFRTLYIGRGLEGVRAALIAAEEEVEGGERRGRAVQRLRTADWRAAEALVDALEQAFAPLVKTFEKGRRHELSDLVRAHVETADALARLPEGDSAPGLWAEVAGDAAALLMTSLLEPGLPGLTLAAREYPDLFRALITGETVRPKVPLHPRLAIWGPLEARLQQPDLVILGGLNDGKWPELGDPGPWLNRPMRATLGLPAPEEKIGYAAHDFAMLMGAERVVVTRALKVEGVPTVASRWLLRLQALLDSLELRDCLEPEQPWLAWAQWRSAAARMRPLPPPAPRPALMLRPRKLSVSAVETWIANPYAIFAREILKLDPLPVIGMEPDAALRGGIVHAALAGFAKAYPAALPDDVAAELMKLARAELEHLSGNPRVAAFWVLRLERFASWFAGSEPARRTGVRQSLVEVSGAMVIDGPAGPFTLTARADRIDVTGLGAIITDYKTGASLTKLRKDADDGFAPQLALEGAIVMARGFTALDTDRIAGLRYISASGGEPAGAEVALKSEDLAGLAAGARDRLAKLIAEFDDPDTPYTAVRRARFSYEFDAYAHLARAAEWAGTSGEGEE
jgi:ATP-dependent helicase/nuclease subunit B